MVEWAAQSSFSSSSPFTQDMRKANGVRTCIRSALASVSRERGGMAWRTEQVCSAVVPHFRIPFPLGSRQLLALAGAEQQLRTAFRHVLLSNTAYPPLTPLRHLQQRHLLSLHLHSKVSQSVRRARAFVALRGGLVSIAGRRGAQRPYGVEEARKEKVRRQPPYLLRSPPSFLATPTFPTPPSPPSMQGPHARNR